MVEVRLGGWSMSDAGLFAIAVVLLLACLAFGFRRWGGVDLGPSGSGAVARFVLVSTAIGGILGAPFWWLDLTPSFAWDLPPVASRMLAAAAFAFGLAGIVVLERPSEARTRLYLTLIPVYLVPLAVAAVLLHLDRFDFTAPVTYGFFAVVVVLSAGSLLTLSRSAGSGSGSGSQWDPILSHGSAIGIVKPNVVFDVYGNPQVSIPRFPPRGQPPTPLSLLTSPCPPRCSLPTYGGVASLPEPLPHSPNTNHEQQGSSSGGSSGRGGSSSSSGSNRGSSGGHSGGR
jgi:uncharacterized membrane protein YgcG